MEKAPLSFTIYPKKKSAKRLIQDLSCRAAEIVVMIKAEAERSRSESYPCIQPHRLAFSRGLVTGGWSRKDGEVSG